MDRPLDAQSLSRNRRKKYLKIGIPVAVVITLFFLFSAWIRPSLNRKDILTGIVRRGSVVETISASGSVVPAFEQSISSPGESRLLSIRKKPGEQVKQGESLLELDGSELKLAIEKIEKELALKVNGRTQLKLDMERTLRDLKGQLNIKNLRLQYLRSKTTQSEKLLTLGAISKDQMEQAKLEEHIAEIEQTELEQSIETTTSSLENQLNSITTEIATLQKERTDLYRQLDLLACKADRNGVVTWINDKIGASIHRGEIVARIADLRSYKVEATVSDIHASRLSVGMPAKVRLNDIDIPAAVRTVYPTVENGVVKFTLALADSSNQLLRPSQRVDVFLIVSKRDNAVKVKKGPFINGNGRQDVFVVKDDNALKRPVVIGVMSFEEVEIIEGLNEGEEVIISDMNEYRHLSQVKIH
jgi:HlyD family secretion protein